MLESLTWCACHRDFRVVICILDNAAHHLGWTPRWLCDWHDRYMRS